MNKSEKIALIEGWSIPTLDVSAMTVDKLDEVITAVEATATEAIEAAKKEVKEAYEGQITELQAKLDEALAKSELAPGKVTAKATIEMDGKTVKKMVVINHGVSLKGVVYTKEAIAADATLISALVANGSGAVQILD